MFHFFLTIVFFISGHSGYKVTVPDRNVVADFFGAMKEALEQKRVASVRRDHWMDYAEDRFGKRFVADVKAVLRISALFCMYPVFYALYDQQVS